MAAKIKKAGIGRLARPVLLAAAALGGGRGFSNFTTLSPPAALGRGSGSGAEPVPPLSLD